MAEFEHEIGLTYLRGMHLNDSKAALNSKKDRHENIGLCVFYYVACVSSARLVDLAFSEAT